ncbi:MAG: serine/threonine protein kinase [Anaerolineae bacterium]|nr:serine/threonine protein kinase [Anaerolineae bacterium]
MADPLLGRQLGDYVIQELLGRGGMARVFKGYDSRLMRYAAVKVITNDAYAQDQAEYAERFRREARAIARLNNPNIVQVYQFGEERDLYYMAMVFIEGKDLRQIIKEHTARGQVMAIEDVLNIAYGIGAALDYAHSRGVIHRDVKPSNIMLDADNRPILTDFGLALSTQEGTFGDTFGSAHYIAPEQAVSSARAVPQSDLYSLGVCVYEMLTGYVPFDDPSAMTVAMKHLNEMPPSPRQYNPNLPVSVERVILRALEKDPKRRHDTGAHFAQSLEAACGDDPDADLQRLLSASGSDSHMRTASKPSSAFRTPLLKDPPNGSDSSSWDNWGSNNEAAKSQHNKVDAKRTTRPSIAIRQDRLRGLVNKRSAPIIGLAALLIVIVVGVLIALSNSSNSTATPTTVGDPQTNIAQVNTTQVDASATSPAAASSTPTAPPATATSQSGIVTGDSTATLVEPSVTPTATRPTYTPSFTWTPTFTRTPTSTATPAPPTWTPNPANTAAPDVVIMYDGDQVNLLNVSGGVLNITGLSFVQRGSDRRFDATDWNSEFSANTTGEWPTFRCYQVYRVGISAEFSPLEGCERIAAFRSVSAPRQFWIPNDASVNTFDVFASGKLIASCQISAGRCEFSLPK